MTKQKMAGIDDRIDFAMPQPFVDTWDSSLKLYRDQHGDDRGLLDCLSIFLGWYYAPGDHFGRPMTVAEAYAIAEATGNLIAKEDMDHEN